MNRSRLDPSQALPMSRDAAIGMILPGRSSLRRAGVPKVSLVAGS